MVNGDRRHVSPNAVAAITPTIDTHCPSYRLGRHIGAALGWTYVRMHNLFMGASTACE